MENSNKPKNLFLKFLPKAASAMSFQNHQFSPGRDHHHHHSSKVRAHAHKGFSGPINFAVLPEEAREKPSKDGSFEAHEPTSPKVSCMGQIKYKHKKKKMMRKVASKNDNIVVNNAVVDDDHEKQSTRSSISKFFNRSSVKKSKSNPSGDHGKEVRRAAVDNKKNTVVPSLGMMNKFASGRESLADFDWTAQIAPLDHDRDYYSDDEERRRDHSDDENDEEREVIIPYSAPIVVGGRSSRGDDDQDVMGRLEPRKEVNLWRRRTMAPPPPLALNSKVRS